jgi:hypothetical protein
MPSPRFTQSTTFSKEVLGRYVCNGFHEATLNADPSPGPDLGRPFPRPAARPSTSSSLVRTHTGSHSLSICSRTTSHRVIAFSFWKADW